MLILPLHQPLTRANFPWATAWLVLINCFVFLFLQTGDAEVYAEAAEYYQDSGLGPIEEPLYRKHLQDGADEQLSEMLEQIPVDMQPEVLAEWQQADDRFRQRLQRGELFADEAAYAAWRPLGDAFAQRRGAAFTDQFSLQAESPSPLTLLSSMFLHGSFDHLLGNMLFLIALGLLVEGPLGPGLFIALYALGGAGAGSAWLAANEQGAVVGASGAIAALMGAFCVLWGRRQVRFFYWFFVVFDYVKGPALALLPAWLGWELLQWMMSDGSRVAYEAHAGGIVGGALLALGVRQLGWQRDSAFVEQASPRQEQSEFRLAMDHLGQMRVAEAERLLGPLAEREPERFDIALARYRCARYAGSGERIQARLESLLRVPATGEAELQEQLRALHECNVGESSLPADLRAQLAQRLLLSGRLEAGLPLLLGIPVEQAVTLDQPQSWLRTALHVQPQSKTVAVQVLQHLLRCYPHSAQAEKARFLLREWSAD